MPLSLQREIEERLMAQENFSEQVRKVAILMCEEMELDPLALVKTAGLPPGSTIYSPHESWNWDTPTIIPAVVQRWELFRKDAALALAGWRAVHKHALTQT